MSARKFLIIQTAFLGDVVLATGLVEALRSQFPEATIDFMVRPGNEGLLLGHPELRHVLVLNKKDKVRGILQMISRLRRERYDCVINVQRFFRTGLITSLSGAAETVGFRQNPLSAFFTRRVDHVIGGVHEVERNHALIRHLTGSRYFRPRLYPTAMQVERVSGLLPASFITVSPASVWFTKQYPAERWVDFLRSAPAAQSVVLLGGPSDLGLCNAIAGQLEGRPILVLAGKLNLLESAAVMQRALMNYVNDSGPMHLCSAVNAPVTAVFCSTIPGFGFGPLSDRSHVVESRVSLDCRPCGLHGHRACPRGHFKCATTIDTAQLLETLGA